MSDTCRTMRIPHEARERGESFKRELIAYTQRLERLCISTRGSLRSHRVCARDNFDGWVRCVHLALSDLEGELDSMGD